MTDEYVIYLKTTQHYVGWEWGRNRWSQFQFLATATKFPTRDMAEKVLASLKRYSKLKPFIVPMSEAKC